MLIELTPGATDLFVIVTYVVSYLASTGLCIENVTLSMLHHTKKCNISQAPACTSV